MKNFNAHFYCVKSTPISSDETSTSYFIPFIKTSVRELIYHILKNKNNFGTIYIEQIRMAEEYKDGKFVKDVVFSGDAEVTKLKIHGGWGQEDYYIEFK